MKYKEYFNGDVIELETMEGRVKIYDEFNSFRCSFDINHLVDMIKQFKDWAKISREYDTSGFHPYGYKGNWIVPGRIKYMIEMLNGTLRFEKKNKSQLKRMAISSIQKDLAILKMLLESRT